MTPPQPIIDQLHDTFTMPCLSKYVFNMWGECYNDKGVSLKTYRGDCYNIWDDNGKKSHVTIAEIIQYGKHVQSLNQYQSGGLELRLPSKINKL